MYSVYTIILVLSAVWGLLHQYHRHVCGVKSVVSTVADSYYTVNIFNTPVIHEFIYCVCGVHYTFYIMVYVPLVGYMVSVCGAE